jgi:hypothetical protein
MSEARRAVPLPGHCAVRDPTDIGHASAPFRILRRALATAGLFGREDLFENSRAAMGFGVADNILLGVVKAVADQFISHIGPLSNVTFSAN